MNRKKIMAILIAALLLLAMAPAYAAEDASFTVTDMAGREVKFDKPVEKAVALTASDCEIIFALGAE